jgi:phenylalanyl-tRNA synthetase alpha chain
VELKQQVEQIEQEAVEAVQKAGDLKQLEQVHVKYLGRKGAIKALLRQLGQLAPEERPVAGQLVNAASERVTAVFQERQEELEQQSRRERVKSESIDVTLPGRQREVGTVHPITRITNQIIDIFSQLGFDVATGPEIETDYYNFEALNIPKNHPARDMQDTFYVAEDVVLRTHTSPVQIRYMETHQPPVRIVSPGRVYRNETADASHLPMFTQVEGLLVDEGITFGNLKGIVEEFVHRMFSPRTQVRFRPSFFPFTEPSAEVDILFEDTGREGQSKVAGKWLEIMGCGMVDPEVYGYVNYDAEKYTGFAFGMGCERIAMLKYGVDDIRHFYDNDVRILNQFL